MSPSKLQFVIELHCDLFIARRTLGFRRPICPIGCTSHAARSSPAVVSPSRSVRVLRLRHPSQYTSAPLVSLGARVVTASRNSATRSRAARSACLRGVPGSGSTGLRAHPGGPGERWENGLASQLPLCDEHRRPGWFGAVFGRAESRQVAGNLSAFPAARSCAASGWHAGRQPVHHPPAYREPAGQPLRSDGGEQPIEHDRGEGRSRQGKDPGVENLRRHPPPHRRQPLHRPYAHDR